MSGWRDTREAELVRFRSAVLIGTALPMDGLRNHVQPHLLAEAATLIGLVQQEICRKRHASSDAAWQEYHEEEMSR